MISRRVDFAAAVLANEERHRGREGEFAEVLEHGQRQREAIARGVEPQRLQERHRSGRWRRGDYEANTPTLITA